MAFFIFPFVSHSQIDSGFVVKDSIRIYHNSTCVIRGLRGKRHLKKYYFQYCKNIIIDSWFNKSLKFSFENNNLEYLTIYNRWKSVTIPESIKTSNVKGISMGKCKNDTMFKYAKNLRYLYYTGSLDKEVFKLDSLEDLTIKLRGKNVDLLNLTNDSNFTLNGLSVYNDKEYVSYKLDSTLLYFKNLKEVAFNFNPFEETNYTILNQLLLLEDVRSYSVDYRDIIITKEMIEKLPEFNIYLSKCLFTKEQMELFKQYANIIIG